MKKAVRIVYTVICVAAVVAGSAGLTQRAWQTEPAPAPGDRIELSLGAVVPDGEGGARIWCTVYEDGHYCCCALIFLAEGGRLASAELSFG